MKFLVTLIALLTATSSLRAQTSSTSVEATRQAYTFEDLSRFWSNLLGDDEADISFYQALFQQMDRAPEEKISRLEAHLQTGTTTSELTSFFVEPIPASLSAGLAKREVGLHMYMNREEYFEAVSASDPRDFIKLKNEIRRQQLLLMAKREQAALELFLIKLARYREAGKLEQKCRFLTEAQRFLDIGFAQVVSDAGLKNSLRNIESMAESISETYKDLLKAKAACQARPALDRAGTLDNIERSLNEKIMRRLKATSDKNIAPIKDIVRSTLESKLDDIYRIDPLTGKLLQFEQDIIAGAASIKLINSDSFGLDTLISENLQKIDFERIRQVSGSRFVPPAIEKVEAEKALLVQQTSQFLKKLEMFHQMAPESLRPDLKNCLGLEKDFSDLLPKAPSEWGAQSAFKGLAPPEKFLVKLEGCLAQAKSYMTRLGEKDAQLKLIDSFSKHLQGLNQEILTITN